MAPRSDPNDQKNADEARLNRAEDEEENDDDDDTINEEELSDADLAEIERVNTHLDSLSSALDAIEQRNDNIHAQLLELLSSNREIRKSLQQEAEASRATDKVDDDTEEPPSNDADTKME